MMNDRIRELMEECIITDINLHGEIYEASFDREKFAELIIRECIKILEEERDMYSWSEYDPLEYVDRIDAKKSALDAGVGSLEYHFDMVEK
jgi:hypothetical protein